MHSTAAIGDDFILPDAAACAGAGTVVRAATLGSDVQSEPEVPFAAVYDEHDIDNAGQDSKESTEQGSNESAA